MSELQEFIQQKKEILGTHGSPMELEGNPMYLISLPRKRENLNEGAKRSSHRARPNCADSLCVRVVRVGSMLSLLYRNSEV